MRNTAGVLGGVLCLGICSAQAASLHSYKSGNIIIPDATFSAPGPKASQYIDLSGAPAGAEITSVTVYYEIRHAWRGDLDVWLTMEEPTGSWHDYVLKTHNISDSGTDIVETRSSLTTWNGLSPNHRWYLCAKDFYEGDEGYIDFFEIWVYYTVPVTDPDLHDDGVSWHTVNTTSITSTGQAFSMGLDVRSSNAASGAHVTRFYFSTNTTITASDYLIGTYSSSGISSGAYQTQSISITWPPASAPPNNTYYIGCLIDATNTVAESDETTSSNTVLLFGGSTQVTVNIVPPPTTPTLTAPSSANSGANYTVSWTASSNHTRYLLQESTSSSFTGATNYVLGVSTTSKAFNHTVGSDTRYYYRVCADNETTGLCSPWSSSDSTLVQAPATPTTPTLTAPSSANSGASYTVSWTASSNHTRYLLQESTASDFSGATAYVLSSGTTSKVFNHTVASSTTYYYRVCADNETTGLTSDWSNTGSTDVVLPSGETEIVEVVVPVLRTPGVAYPCTVKYTVEAPDDYRIQVSATDFSTWTCAASQEVTYTAANYQGTHQCSFSITPAAAEPQGSFRVLLEKKVLLVLWEFQDERNLKVVCDLGEVVNLPGNGCVGAAENSILTAAELAQEFMPVMRFSTDDTFGHGDEAWTPSDTSVMLDRAQLFRFDQFLADELIHSSPGAATLTAHPFSDYYLDLFDNVGNRDDWDQARTHHSSSDAIYYTVVMDGSWLVVQYWFFYYYNDWVNDHEGDWESISIFFENQSDTYVPSLVGMSSHHTLTKRVWSKTAKWIDSSGSRTLRPVVYVANGGHGNYFWSGQSGAFDTDDHDGSVLTIPELSREFGLIAMPRTQGVGPASSWIDYAGRWGYYRETLEPGGCGPRGPAFRESSMIWTTPRGWFTATTSFDGISSDPTWSDLSSSWDADPNTVNASVPSGLEADAGPDQAANIDMPVTFSGTCGGSDKPTKIMCYSWDFDHTDGIQEDATGDTTSHTYTASGSFTVTLTIWEQVGDEWFATSTDTALVNVSDGGPSPKPDLIIESITHSPSSPASGGTVTFTVTVRNQGSVDASLFAVGFWSNLSTDPMIADAPEDQKDVVSLFAGTSTTLDFTVTAGSDGTYTAWAYADRYGGASEVDESIETNNAGPLGGHSWTVSTGGSPPPSKATSPSPSSGASGVSITTDLTWSNGGGATSYLVYFGTDPSPDSTEYKGEQGGTTYDPGTLSYSTTYYWQINAKNSDGTTTGDVWSFTTGSAAPAGTLTLTYPVGGETFTVGTAETITWTSTGSPGSDVKIELTRNAGSTWETLIASTTNDGSWGWASVAGTDSVECMVKVTSTADSSIWDQSISFFSIAAPPSPIAVIEDAWWTNEVDSDGDGYTCSARLNWNPDVSGGAGSLEVYEEIYWKSASGSTWNLITTTSPHTITGTDTSDGQFRGFSANATALFDWKIAIYRKGEPTPDYSRDPANDADLDDYMMESEAQDAEGDTVGPAVEVTSPTSSSTYTTSSSSINIGGTASDNVGVTSVTWSNDRGGSGTCSGTTSWSQNGITLYSGQNTITLTAYDAAGNPGTATLTVTCDTTSPAVTITSPTSSATYTSSNSTMDVGGSASDNVGVTSVTWSNDRGGSGTCSGTTSWSKSGITLYSGQNVITVTAHDAAGSMGTAALTVTYDTTTPTVTITTPTSGSTYTTSSSTMDIGGTASDNVAVTSVTWSNDRGGNGTCSETTSWSQRTVALYDGSNVITVTAHDAAGNMGTATLTVTYSNVPQSVGDEGCSPSRSGGPAGILAWLLPLVSAAFAVRRRRNTRDALLQNP